MWIKNKSTNFSLTVLRFKDKNAQNKDLMGKEAFIK